MSNFEKIAKNAQNSKKTQILRIVVKIAVLGVVVRILVQIFWREVIDINGHFRLNNDCPGWLVKIQEPR